MMELPKSEQSYWTKIPLKATYPKLKKDIAVDVCIIGAGMAGLTAAYFLTRAGKKVAVIEKNFVASGVTGSTTGKVTSGHNLTYKKLVDRQGLRKARHYAESNEAAVRVIAGIIREHKISCDWQFADNYVVTENPETVRSLYKEAKTADKIGLPATFERETPSPFWVEGAVRYKHHGQMDATKYLKGLATYLDQNGCDIYEQTKAKRVRDKRGIVKVKGGKVRAKHIVIATNVPFPPIAHGLYCALEYPLKSYIIAVKTNLPIKGMYIMPDKPKYSVLPVKNGSESLLLVGGEGHVPGLSFSSKKHHAKLAEFAERRLGASVVKYRWSASDYLGYDQMPLIGKLYPWSKRTYVATGFMKWGLTNGTVAGMIISDQILGNKNTWAEDLRPNRMSAIKAMPRVYIEYLFRKH